MSTLLFTQTNFFHQPEYSLDMKVGKYTIMRSIFHPCLLWNRGSWETDEKENSFCCLYHKESKIHFADIKYNWEFPIKLSAGIVVQNFWTFFCVKNHDEIVKARKGWGSDWAHYDYPAFIDVKKALISTLETYFLR